MKFGVVIFPGSNCDQDLIRALSEVSGQSVEQLWHKEKDLRGCDFIFLPGGFSYGDYLRSGAIARFSPVMESVIEHAAKGGFVMGICNGFQILCEAGLLPGALLRNENRSFICENVYIVAQNTNTPPTAGLNEARPLKVPVAHGEGRYYADPGTLKKINENGQVLFRYCDHQGITNSSINPNGSVENIAGICNGSFNVFGMMPHPERCSSADLLNTDGRSIFEGILNWGRATA